MSDPLVKPQKAALANMRVRVRFGLVVINA